MKENEGKIENLFYEAKFSQVIAFYEGLTPQEKMNSNLMLIVANAYFEKAMPAKAEEFFKMATSTEQDQGQSRLYALGRLSYMSGDKEQATEIFSQLAIISKDKKWKLRSLLGLANLHFDSGNSEELDNVLEELEEFTNLNDAEQISLLHIQALSFMHLYKSPQTAFEMLQDAMSLAGKHGWNYFIWRSLLQMALVGELADRPNEMHVSLQILKSVLKDSECDHLNYLVAKKFSEKVETKLAVNFDPQNMRIMLNERWHCFFEKPKMYQFLELLHKRNEFVKKQALAEEIWPEEPYAPKTHDPRIFDLAKRIRNELDNQKINSITLKSGRMGYKLVSNM